MKQIVHLHEPQRFAFQHVLAIAQPTTNFSAWNDSVGHISPTFERWSKRPSNIDVGHVARLHINLRHPSPQDLTRMVAYYGGAPSSITTFIQHLRCSTCDRLKTHNNHDQLPCRSSSLVNLARKSKVAFSTCDFSQQRLFQSYGGQSNGVS